MSIYEIIEKARSPRLHLPEIDVRDTISFQTGISSGVNQLPLPQLYKDMFRIEAEESNLIKYYTQTTGTPMLTEAIKIYEALSADPSGQTVCFEHLCVTAGASAALCFFFEYFARKHPGESVLMLGLNYYLFFDCMIRNDISYKTICSTEQGRVAPLIEEIIQELRNGKYKLVVLTMPFNPSGEIYTEAELICLIQYLKENGIMLLYDKCQAEEFADQFQYINFNKLIVENGYDNEIIIINSLSKTRSLAGARLGYIMANKEIIDYVVFNNEYYYYNHSQVYIIPIVIDQLCKSMDIISQYNKMPIRKLVKKFRNMIVMCSGFQFYNTYFKKIFEENVLNDVLQKLKYDINSNYRVIYQNYMFFKNELSNYIDDITVLQGGFNFCFKLINTHSREQLEFCSSLSKHIKTIILPESFYNGSVIKETDNPFWIRVTCAIDTNTFQLYVMNIKDYLSKLGEI